MTDQGKADQELIDKLIESGKLSDEQLESFQDMKSKSARYRGELTTKQREWVTALALKLDVDMGAANLVSSGQVKVTPEARESLQAFIGSMQRPTLPPHRRCTFNKACQKPKGHAGQCWPIANMEPIG